MTLRIIFLTLTLLLSGCDLEKLLEDPKVAQKEADAKAIGGACRQGMRALEDCYAMNEKMPKAGIFAGWREMDVYMRENKIEGIAPKGVKPPGVEAVAPDEEVVVPAKSDKKADAAKAEPKTEAKAGAKSDTKSDAKSDKKPEPKAKP